MRQQQLSEESLSWLAMANLTPERLATQLDPLPSLPENVHIYHCDHLGTPLALLDRRGKIGWQVTRDPWGNVVRENNLEHLEQPIGMQGQHYDTESGLYYNRHRYYDPWQGKYITQDPIGLNGGINFYSYPGNPVQNIDALGLNTIAAGAAVGAAGGPIGAAVGAGIGAAIGIGAYLYATSDSDSEVQTNTQALSCTTCRPKCLEATPENIRQVVQPTSWQTTQKTVSVPVVARYTKLLESGSIAPSVKMDGNIIAEGNHRMVAGLLCNKLPGIDPGIVSPTRPTFPFNEIQPDMSDWGNY